MVDMACKTEGRRSIAIDKNVNGIDYIEVLTSPSGAVSDPYQALLLVRCFHPISEKLDEINVAIAGGSRIRNIKAIWARRADDDLDLGQEEQKIVNALHDKDRVLVVRPSARGDFSTYMLTIVSHDNSSLAPSGFDERLSKMEFTFKVECQGDFDCPPANLHEEPMPAQPNPPIDYMAKDYASFRRLMLDRLATIAPDWKERNPADMGVVLVELLAYVGDHLSYYQDAVATEAYLGTARRRVSIRRHARLLDYFMHDGCNARAWVFIQVNGDVAESVDVPAKTKLIAFSKRQQGRAVVRPNDLAFEVAEGAKVFETMHDAVLYSAHNNILFHTWGDEKCYLPKGATSTTLQNAGKKLKIKIGDVLLFEEVSTGTTETAKNTQKNGDMTHRHAVRLTSITPKFDHLLKVDVIEVSWHTQDALPFALCVREEQEKGHLKMAVARGNIVLADHGLTIFDYDINNRLVDKKELIGSVPATGKLHPKLANKEPLTYACPFDESQPASFSLECDPRMALPQVKVQGNGFDHWEPVWDLLNSDMQAYQFVVETENDGSCYIRFGDKETRAGRIPASGTEPRSELFSATYRTGSGKSGNVGAETIASIVWDTDAISEVRNPLDARGGSEPEDVDKVKQFAPTAFLKQKRAVTEQDYEEMLALRGDIQRARATIRWTGSWHTVFVAIDRAGGLEVDADFEWEIRNYLEGYRMAGYDIEVHGPIYVPLKLSIRVTVARGYFAERVEQALVDALSNRGNGFFHPDNFTFGQPVFLSQIYAAAAKVPGVQAIEVVKFTRMDMLNDTTALEQGVIRMNKFEITRLDSDPNYPENGSIEFHMEGGK